MSRENSSPKYPAVNEAYCCLIPYRPSADACIRIRLPPSPSQLVILLYIRISCCGTKEYHHWPRLIIVFWRDLKFSWFIGQWRDSSCVSCCIYPYDDPMRRDLSSQDQTQTDPALNYKDTAEHRRHTVATRVPATARKYPKGEIHKIYCKRAVSIRAPIQIHGPCFRIFLPRYKYNSRDIGGRGVYERRIKNLVANIKFGRAVSCTLLFIVPYRVFLPQSQMNVAQDTWRRTISVRARQEYSSLSDTVL